MTMQLPRCNAYVCCAVSSQAENMMNHETEIYSRPARTWFQTEKQKRAVAEKAKAVADGKAAEDDDEQMVSHCCMHD